MAGPKFSPIQLRAIRQQAGMSRTALAFAVRRDADTVRDWERGKHAPSVAALEALAEVLNVSVATFFEVVHD